MTKCKSYLLIKSKVGGVGTGGGTDTTGVGGVTGTSGAYTNPTSTTESIYSATRTSTLLLGTLPAEDPPASGPISATMPFLISLNADGSDPKVLKSVFQFKNPCGVNPAVFFNVPSDFSASVAWIGTYGRVDGTMTYDATSVPRSRRLQTQSNGVGLAGIAAFTDGSGLTNTSFPTDAFLGIGVMYISSDTPTITADTVVLKRDEDFLEPYSFNGKKVYTHYTYESRNPAAAGNRTWTVGKTITALLNQSSGTAYQNGAGMSSIQFSIEGASGGPTTAVPGTKTVNYIAGNTEGIGHFFALTTYASDEDAEDLSMDLNPRDYPVITDAASYGRDFKTIYARVTLNSSTDWMVIPNIPKVSTQPTFLWKVGYIEIGTKQYATNVMVEFRWHNGEWEIKNTSSTSYGHDAVLLIKYY